MSGYNPEALLKRLPSDALYEERAMLLGKMNQHELALSLYVHKVYQVNIILYLLCNIELQCCSHFQITQMHFKFNCFMHVYFI